MRPLIILALVGLALAALDDTDYDQIYSQTHQRQIEDTSFESGREYRYFYDGQAMTGIPGTSKQHSATRIQALVIWQVQEGKSMITLTHIRMGHLNRIVPNPRAELPFGAFEPAEIQTHLREQLQKPIQFKYEQGEITDLVIDHKDEPWSVNIKRGVLNMLQLKLREEGERDLESNSIVPGNAHAKHYRTTEKTLEGECEVIYNIESLPNLRHSSGRPVLNVTKSINFEECQNRPEVKYNWRFHQDCPNCDPKFKEDEKSLKSATVIRYNITGDREKFLIESAKVESHYMLVPFNEEANVIITYVNQTLVLYKTGPIQTQHQELQSPVESESDLVYSIEWDQWKEKFYMEGDKTFHNRNPYSDIPNKIEMVADILMKLVSSMEHEVTLTAPRQLDRLVILLRMLNKEDIEQIHEQFYKGGHSTFSVEQKKKAKDLIMNAIALCGTKECIFHLIKHVESGEIPTLRAASALRQLHQARVVSPKMIQELKKLVELPRVQESMVLKQAVYLSLGSMIYTSCGNQNDQMAVELNQETNDPQQNKLICSESQKREFVTWMWSKFESAHKPEDRILILKMIGNSGLDEQSNVLKLEKVIQQKEHHYHPKVRIVAIGATRLLIETRPKKVQRMLVPIMLNKYEDPEIRIAAAYFTIQTYPDRFLLNMIAKELNSEPNYQYKTFLWTYLNDLANSTNPCYQELASNLKLSLRFAHKIDATLGSSRYRSFGYYSKSYKSGLDIEPFLTMSNTSFFPRQMGLNLAQSGMGFFGKWATTVGFSASGLDKLIWKFMGPSGWLHEREWNTPLRRSPRDTSSSRKYSHELKSYYDDMKVSKNYYREPKDPMAYFYLRYLGQDLFYYPIKSEIIQQFLEEGTSGFSLASDVLPFLGKPFEHSYATLLTDFKYKIPSTLGLPLTIRYKTPVVATIKGKVDLQVNGDMRSFTLNCDLKPSVAAKLIESMEVWNPVVNSGLKVVVEGKVFTPIKAQIKADISKPEKLIKIIFDAPTETRELLVLQSRPMTYTRVWPKSLKIWEDADEMTILGKEHNRVKTIDRSYFENLLGIKLQVKGRLHWTPMIRQANTPFMPYSGPNKIVIETSPGVGVPNKIELTLKGTFRNNGESISPELQFPPQFAEESSSSSESSEQQSTTHGRRTERGGAFESSSLKADRKHMLIAHLKTIGGTDREVKWETEVKYSQDLRFTKLQGKVHVSKLPNSNHQYTTCYKAEMLYPKAPTSASDTYDKKVFGDLKINWSPSADCQETNFIKASLQAERSNKQLEEESDDFAYWQCRKASSPVGCDRYLGKAGELKKYVLNMEYDNVPTIVKNVTNKLWRFVKHHYFWQTDVAQIKVHNADNKIKAIIRIDPFTNRFLNVTVKTPKENVTMVDIPLGFRFRALNVKRSVMSQMFDEAIYGQESPVCELSTHRVKTFDQAEFGFKLANCWTVLAKDCSSERTFAVLAKKTSNDQGELEVKIVTPYNKIQLKKKEGNSFFVKKDDESERNIQGEPLEIMNHGHVVMTVEPMDDQYIKVWLPEQQLKVYFDGQHVNVKMLAPIYMGRQCGICGNMDQDPENEFYKMDSEADYYEPEYDTRKAFHSYTLQDAECQRPETSQEMCEDDNCEYDQTPFPDEYRKSRPYDLPNEFDYRSTIKPVRQIKKIERGGKICWSKVKIPVCPKHTYPSEIKTTEEVEFTCQQRSSSNWGNSFENSGSSSSSESQSNEQQQSNERSTSNPHNRRGSNSKSKSQEQSNSNEIDSNASNNVDNNESSQQSVENDKSTSASSKHSSRSGSTSFTMTVRIPKTCQRL